MGYSGRSRTRPKNSVVRSAFDSLASARQSSPEAYDPEQIHALSVLEGERFSVVHDGATRRISRAGEFTLWVASQRRAERRAETTEPQQPVLLPPQVFDGVEFAS